MSEHAAERDAGIWQAHLAYSLGFVASTDEEARAVLALWPDEDAIEAEYGDSQPREIIVVRGSATPKPQHEGSTFLRLPGTYYSRDHIEIASDLDSVEDGETAIALYEAAIGAAERLNRLGGSDV